MIDYIFALLIFFLGSSIASFINVLVYRIEEGFDIKALLFKPSHCEKCKKQLTWYELIPVFGWLVIRGRCPKCKERISILYPISEFILGITFALTFYLSCGYIYYIIFVMLFMLSLFDIVAQKQIPKNILNTFLIVGLAIFLYRYYIGEATAIPLIEASLLSLLLFGINLAKKSFGFGDILVIFLVSFFAKDYDVVKTFFFAVILGALVGILLIAKNRSWLKRFIPFIPFLAIGFAIATFLPIQMPF